MLNVIWATEAYQQLECHSDLDFRNDDCRSDTCHVLLHSMHTASACLELSVQILFLLTEAQQCAQGCAMSDGD